MMLYFYILVFLGLFHDVPVADFTLTISDRYLDIDIMMEQEDLQSILLLQSAEPTGADISDYLQDNFSLKVNNKPLSLNYCHIELNYGHYLIQAEHQLEDTNPTFIEIKNTCLLKVPNQINNTFLHYNSKRRGFKMDNSRTTIQVTL